MREQIRSEFETIEPFDDLEAQHRTEALAWIATGADLFRLAKPALPPQHLVSYFAVVDDDHILLVDHRDAGLWLPTGGHLERDEHPRRTVVRELHEELGLVATHPIDAPVMVTCTTTVGATAGHTDVSLWYVVRAPRSQRLAFDEREFESIRWFPFRDIPRERTDPHLGRFVAKLMSASVG